MASSWMEILLLKHQMSQHQKRLFYAQLVKGLLMRLYRQHEVYVNYQLSQLFSHHGFTLHVILSA